MPDDLQLQQDALAMILAAFRRDHEALALLVTTAPVEQLPHLLAVCAQFAATTCHQAAASSPHLDFDAG